MLRIFLILLALAGAALGIVYPWAAENLAGYEIGSWRVYDRAAGFMPAEASLTPSEAPVFVVVEMVTLGPLPRGDRTAVLTVTADTQGRTVLAQALDFEGVEATIINPQAAEQLYRTEIARIDPVEAGRYLFSFGPGESGTDQLASVKLTLNAGAFDLDARAIPAGYVLMALGLVGFVASFRRKRPQNPNSSPPPSRWGRGNG